MLGFDAVVWVLLALFFALIFFLFLMLRRTLTSFNEGVNAGKQR